MFSHDDICEIWVGPRLDFNCAEERIRQILKESGYYENKVKILESQALYRG